MMMLCAAHQGEKTMGEWQEQRDERQVLGSLEEAEQLEQWHYRRWYRDRVHTS
jgi:hypothetical protein